MDAEMVEAMLMEVRIAERDRIWKTIDSAPKDGTPILGYADGDMAVVKWYGDYWTLVVVGAGTEDGEWNPIHWMELPEAP